MVVDRTGGRYTGRVYISVMRLYPKYTIGLFWSTDGHAFRSAVAAVNEDSTVGINTTTPLILSDGMLVIPYRDFPLRPEQSATADRSTLWFVTSSDGGARFSAPRKILTQQLDTTRAWHYTRNFPQLAVDARSHRYRDRIYVVWGDARSGRSRLLFSYSSDRGRRWSVPRPVDPNAPAGAVQYQPAIAVNRDGVVGVTWFDTRHSDGRSMAHGYDQYFAASVDGGESFEAPVRVSSVTSMPFGAGNMRFIPYTYRLDVDSMRVVLLSAANTWGSGGDYMGLAADTDGVFHPLWTDSREGTFQLFSARVTVLGGRVRQEAPPRTSSNLTRRLKLMFESTSYNSTSRELEIAVRLKNISGHTVHGPFTVVVTGFVAGADETFGQRTPEILNASNGKTGSGATFEYVAASGSVNVLRPGAQSEPITWRLKLADPLQAQQLQLTIQGFD
jgi:hypothetical protein